MADTKVSALPSATLPLDGTELVPIVQGGVSKKIIAADAGVWLTKALAADQNNSTVTPTKVTGLDRALPVGIYQIQYLIRYQSSVTTTGIKLDLNFSGTVTSFVWNQRWIDVSATAATATPDQDNIQAAGAVVGGFASRAKGTAGRGVLLGVDTINADMLVVVEALAVVTVAGNLELWHGSETANQTTIKAGSSVAAIKVG